MFNTTGINSLPELLHTSKNATFTYLFILSLLIPLLLASCDSVTQGDEDSKFCTQELRTSTVTVVQEQNEQPVHSIQITVKNKESSEVFDICESGICSDSPELNPGTYVIFHDGFQDDIDADGKEIIVQGTKGDSLSFSQEYTFGSDGCHIQKFAGPDTISISTTDG